MLYSIFISPSSSNYYLYIFELYLNDIIPLSMNLVVSTVHQLTFFFHHWYHITYVILSTYSILILFTPNPEVNIDSVQCGGKTTLQISLHISVLSTTATSSSSSSSSAAAAATISEKIRIHFYPTRTISLSYWMRVPAQSNGDGWILHWIYTNTTTPTKIICTCASFVGDNGSSWLGGTKTRSIQRAQQQ